MMALLCRKQLIRTLLRIDRPPGIGVVASPDGRMSVLSRDVFGARSKCKRSTSGDLSDLMFLGVWEWEPLLCSVCSGELRTRAM